jgi:replicative DNA helicase
MSELVNIASERAVLAGICRYGLDCYLDIEALLEEDTFSVDYNKVLYKCVKDILSKSDKVDFVSVLSAGHALSLGEYVEKQEVLKHIHGIMETPVDVNSVKLHAKKIRRLQFGRHLQNTIRESWKSLSSINGDESISEIMGLVETPIQDASLLYTKQDDFRPKGVGEDIDAYIAHLMSDDKPSIGLPTNFPSWDSSIGGGLRRKCIDLVAARSKQGKSLLGQSIALHLSSELQIPVLILDTEMSEEDNRNRMLANISGVPINEIASGRFVRDPKSKQDVLKAAEVLKSTKCKHINITGKPFPEMLAIARRWILKDVGFQSNGRTNDCLIIYDYLKLTSTEGISNALAEHQVLGFQMIQLHNFVVEHDCSCLCFVQLNRDGITKETIDTIAGSDRLVWVATSISIFKDKSAEEIADDGPRNGNKKIVPLVARHGPGMEDGGYICCQMNGDIARIKEIGPVRINRRDFPENSPSEEEVEDEDT